MHWIRQFVVSQSRQHSPSIGMVLGSHWYIDQTAPEKLQNIFSALFFFDSDATLVHCKLSEWPFHSCNNRHSKLIFFFLPLCLREGVVKVETHQLCVYKGCVQGNEVENYKPVTEEFHETE